MLELLQSNKSTELCELILDKINFFIQKDKNSLSEDAKIFIETFLEIFTTDKFIIPEKFQKLFIKESNNIAILVKLILENNTDKYLKNLLDQKPYQNNLANHLSKVLTLYSVKNNIKIDYKILFDTDKKLASVWYWSFFDTKNNLLNITTENIREHINQIEQIKDKLEFADNIDKAYFISTYISDKSQIIKKEINKIIKKEFKSLVINNNPDIKKLAIVSSFWNEESPIYNVLYSFIKYLSKFYEITLINLGDSDYFDKENIFTNIKNISYKNNVLDLSEIEENDFQIIYYTEIGINIESIILSNLRLAPIQITGYGNITSTFGSEIDYFVVGENTEIITELENNYSEKVIVTPFNSLKPLRLDDITISSSEVITKDKIIISCLSPISKLDNNYILMLGKIIQNSKKKLVIRFLCDELSSIVLEEFKYDLEDLLGKENIEVYGKLNHKEYISICNESDLIIDSYPFGEFNTVIYSLYLKKPFFIIEGNKSYNKIASSILKKIALSELICTRTNEFIIKVLKAINNPNYLMEIKNKIKEAPINLIFGRSDEHILKQAFEELIINKDNIRDKKLISFTYKDINNNKELIDKFRSYLNNRKFLDSEEKYSELKEFFLTFLDSFVKDDFIIKEDEIIHFINLSADIGFLSKVFGLETTDSYILKLLNNNLNEYSILDISKLTKILTLYSFNNEIELDYKKFFECEKAISSYWYWKSFIFASYNSEKVSNRIKQHCNNFDLIQKDLLLQIDVSQYGYFFITYAYPKYERKIKSKINELTQKSFQKLSIVENKYNKKKIGVVSEYLRQRHAVRRSLYKFIEALAEDYELYLINIGEVMFITDPKVFKDVIKIDLKNNNLDIKDIPKDLYTIYYPDIGMNALSIQISNLRLAPIQIMGYGHPVSTFGSEIDYFIGGAKVESIEKAKDNYSEKLVLLDEMAVTPEYPLYKIPEETINNSEFIIACPWTLQKTNYEHLITVKEILKRSNKKVKLIFFTGIPEKALFYYSKIEIEEFFNGFDVEVLSAIDYNGYMDKMNECTIAIEPYHFGGYNIVVDSIFLRKPVVSFNGDRGYNNFASKLLEKIDLKELIATNKDEYINKVVEIINNDTYRSNLVDKIKSIDLEKALFNKKELESFKRAFHYLIENHDELKKDKENRVIII